MRNSDPVLDTSNAVERVKAKRARRGVKSETAKAVRASVRTPFTQLKLGVNDMRMCYAGVEVGLAFIGFLVHFAVKAMRTLLIALLFGFPVLADAADDWPASNWIWQMPPEQRSFSGLLTDAEFRIVVRELENRRGHDLLSPSNQMIDPTRKGNGVEAAELLNGLRMDRYRQDCERLKHGQMHGSPASYPTQIPLLGNP